MSLLKKPIFWIGIAAVGAIAWVATTPETVERKSGSGTRVARQKTSKKKSVVQFTQEDQDAKFAPLSAQMKNAFQPIVIRKGGGFGSGDGAANAIPLDFTGGDGGWVYTGTAEIDGSITALLENRTSGDGVFLKAGQRWKSAAVNKILPDAVVMTGPSGTKTFTLVNEESPRMASGYSPAPVNVPPSLRGQIGGRGQNGGFPNGQALQVLPDASGGNFAAPADGGPSVVFTPMD